MVPGTPEACPIDPGQELVSDVVDMLALQEGG